VLRSRGSGIFSSRMLSNIYGNAETGLRPSDNIPFQGCFRGSLGVVQAS
jgi:hypothetical protein